MIEFKKGNIFQSDCEALTNAVNTKSVMGAGLAKAFKVNFPEMYLEYAKACYTGKLKTGSVHVWENPNGNPKYVVNFPTKDDWRTPSEMSYIVDGLIALKDEIIKRDIKSIAIPSLGCGLGGLLWAEVKPLIEAFEKTLPEPVRVVVYEPLE